jgi:hypothetical protein
MRALVLGYNKDVRNVAFLLLDVCCAAVLSSAAAHATPSPTAPDPYLIYSRCVTAMRESPTPPFMTYDLHIDADHISVSRTFLNDAPVTTLHFRITHNRQNYRVWYRGRDQKALMQDLDSNQVAVAPPVPWALDFHSRTADPSSALENANSGGVTTNEEGALLRELSTDQSRDYRITFAGMVNDDNQPAYRLLLQSVSGDPNAHALRQLVVDPTTYRARQVVMEVSEHKALYGGRIAITANFSQVGPYWISTTGSITGRGYYMIFFLNGSYTFTTSNIRFPENIPAAYFQPNGAGDAGPRSTSALEIQK